MKYFISIVVVVFTLSLLHVTKGQDLTPNCRRDWIKYRASRFTQLWAMKMWDSSGKPESGTLEGNLFWEGDYDECLRVNENETDRNSIKGLFCVAYWMNYLKLPLLTKGFGYCIPDSCSDEDARILLNDIVPYGPIFGPDDNNTESWCIRDYGDLSEDAGAIVALVIISVFIAIVGFATFYDVYYIPKPGMIEPRQKTNVALSSTVSNGITGDTKRTLIENGDMAMQEKRSSNSYDLTAEVERGKEDHYEPGIVSKLILAFSLDQNIPRLVAAKHTPGSFTSLHGIRFLAMCGVVWGHVYSAFYAVSSNRFPIIREFLQAFWTELFYRLWLVVDTFFLMSGFLVTYSLMKAIEKQKKVNIRMMILYYFHRFWRLTPVYMIILMFYITLFPYMLKSPLNWSPSLNDVQNCKEIWWRNLLYIQNLWPSSNFQDCFGVAWYIAIDMQLYIAAPVFVITVYYFTKIGTILIAAGYAGSLTSLIVTLHNIYVEQMEDLDPYIAAYIKPWTRATSYFIGITLGVLLFKTRCKIKMNYLVLTIGWIVAFGLIFISMYIGYLQRCDAPGCTGWFTPQGTVALMSLAPTMYVSGVAWIILACTCGYGGFINSILSWKGFIPMSRLSYTIYLFHLMTLYHYLFSSPVQFYAYNYGINYTFAGVFIITMAICFILTLLFEIPMAGIEKVLIPRR